MPTDHDAAPSVFTRIIDGELPGRFVWRDDEVVAFLSIGPIATGHTLVVPRRQVDRWTDLDAATWTAVADVAHVIGNALQTAFQPLRVGQMIAGLEVPHCHVHVIPMQSMADLDFGRVDPDPDPAVLDDAAERIRAALREMGHNNVS